MFSVSANIEKRTEANITDAGMSGIPIATVRTANSYSGPPLTPVGSIATQLSNRKQRQAQVKKPVRVQKVKKVSQRV